MEHSRRRGRAPTAWQGSCSSQQEPWPHHTPALGRGWSPHPVDTQVLSGPGWGRRVHLIRDPGNVLSAPSGPELSPSALTPPSCLSWPSAAPSPVNPALDPPPLPAGTVQPGLPSGCQRREGHVAVGLWGLSVCKTSWPRDEDQDCSGRVG